ncbi:MAG: hypothetical protein AB1609_06230 [Bacillota bacterium]
MRRLHVVLLRAGIATLAAAVAVASWSSWGPAGVVESAGADIEKQWSTSGHADRELAVEEATVDFRKATAAHCGRCHSSQGFAAWTRQLAAGNPGNLVGPDGKAATVEYLASLGLTAQAVKPIDCDACHTETFELRVSGSTPALPAGFEARGVGNGALCMACHNTRNGKVAWDAADPGRYTAPHHSAQADVIMGKNVFFVNYDAADYVSAHAAFTGNSCVTCHVELGEGHTFHASEKVCATCHGSGYEAEMVQKPTRLLLDETKAAINARFAAQFRDKITRVGAWDPETDKTEERPLAGSEIVSVTPTGIHGQMGFEMVLKDGSTVWAQLGNLKGADGKPVIPTGDPLVRATWNYLLVLWDGSYGIHNPSFARTVLLSSQQALR